MAFDPAQYLSEKTKSPGFDPAAYLAQKTGIPSPDISMGESALRGAAQGASFGFAPAITGALEAIPEASGVLTGQSSMQDVLDAYNKAREASKTNYEAAEKANPKSYMAGGFAGALAPALLTGGASELASGGLAAAKAGALTGAKYGALSGAGGAVSSGEDLGQGLKDVAIGGASGAALGGALGGAVPAIKYGAGKLQENVLSPLGNLLNKTEMGSTLGGAFKMGQEGENLLNKATREKIGQEGYNVANEYIGPKGKFRDLLKQKGKTIADVIKNSADKELNVEDEGLLDNLTTKISQLDDRDPDQAADKKKLSDLLKNYFGGNEPEVAEAGVGMPTTGITANPEDLQSLKGSLSNLSPFKNDSLRSQQGANISKLLSGDVSDYLEQNVPGLADANKDYGDVSNALKMLKANPKAVDQQKQIENLNNIIYRLKNTTKTGDLARQRFTKGTDLLNQAAPELTNEFTENAADTAKRIDIARKASAESFPGSGIVNTIKGATVKTANALGSGSKGMSNTLSTVSNYLTSMPKEKIVSFGQQLSQSTDPLSQKLGNVLSKAGERDDIGRNALMFSLMQNSGYRELLHNYFGDAAVKTGASDGKQ